MKIVKPSNLGLLPRPFTFAGQTVLCVSAYAFFRFDHGGQLLEDSSMWEALDKTLLENELFDTGEPKPRAEYLVYGSCHPKDNSRAARIRLQVGKQQKSLEIFGDRQWSMGIPGDPAMLDPLRICWQHAFGGAGHPYNPLGKGYNPAPKGPVSLPNILSPNRGADPQNAELLPAGLTAYPPDSPLRTQFYGAFDKAWLRDTWPAVPTDSKPEIFMTAPDDQWLPDFFQGGEAVYIEGMHPEHRFQETTLPRLRARIFARKKGESPEPL